MTTASTRRRIQAFPPSLALKLSEVERKIRWVAALRGLGRVALVLTLAAAFMMTLDAGLGLGSAARVGCFIVWCTGGLLGFAAGVLAPLVRRVARMELAAVAEVRHPELGERLTSIASLLDPARRNEAHGSQQLIAALADQADTHVSGLDLSRTIAWRRGLAWLCIGLLATALLLLPTLLRPDPFATLAGRFFAPWQNHRQLSLFAIDVEPGNHIAAIGDDVPIRARIRPRFPWPGALPTTAILEWAGPDNRISRLTLKPEESSSPEERRFATTLRALRGSVGYRVTTHRSTSPIYRIQALEPPRVALFTARVEPPNYTGRPAQVATSAASLRLFEGSRVTLTVVPNRAMRAVSIAWPTPEIVAPLEKGQRSRRVPLTPSADGLLWTAQLEALASGSFSFELVDEHQLTNRSDSARRVVLVADAAPTLALGGSDEPLESKPDDVLVVDFAARDDVAVAEVALRYAVNRSRPAQRPDAEPSGQGAIPTTLDGLQTPLAVGQATLALSNLGLEPGDELEYEVEVKDNRPPPRGPNVTRSTSRRLYIRTHADPLLTHAGREERQTLRARLEALRNDVAAINEQTTQLRYAADAAQGGNAIWSDDRARSLSLQETSARQVITGLDTLARGLLDSRRFASLARPARQAADVEGEGARTMLERAGQTPQPTLRLANLRLADARLAAFRARLDELLQKFDELSRQDDDRLKLHELAAREDDLARQAEALASSANPAKLDELRAKQDALRSEVDEIIRRSPELRAEVMSRQWNQAETLAQLARDFAQRLRSQEERVQGDPARASAFRDLAREQREIVSEARRLALDLDSPLQEHGRARVQLPQLDQPAQPLERGDIESAQQALAQADGELRRLLDDLQSMLTDPRTIAERLGRRQSELLQQASRLAQARNADHASIDRLEKQQADLAQLAASLAVHPETVATAAQATKALARARDALAARQPNAQVLSRLEEARNALTNLANALPTSAQRRAGAAAQVANLQRQLSEMANEIHRLLQETPPSNRPIESARQLARRVQPLAPRALAIADQLVKTRLEGRADSQRNRAIGRIRTLAKTLEQIRDTAPSDSSSEPKSVPITSWHVVGRFDFDIPVPFPLDRPIDLAKSFLDRRQATTSWTPVRTRPDGSVDLVAHFGAGETSRNASAFACTDINIPDGGPGRLVIGSDDTLTLWLNGRQIFDFQGRRPYGLGQDAIDVGLEAGANRLVARCGNGEADWRFSVAYVAPPSTVDAQRLARLQSLRRRLALLPSDAQIALERLAEAIDGRIPADERARALAAQLDELGGQERPAVDEIARIAAALRTLRTPDAPSFQAEALRLLAQPSDRMNMKEATRAVGALAARLEDRLSLAAHAVALAGTERSLIERIKTEGIPRIAQAQREVGDDLARLPDVNATLHDNPGPQAKSLLDAEGAVQEAMAAAEGVAVGQPDPAARQGLEATTSRAASALDALARSVESTGNRPSIALADEVAPQRADGDVLRDPPEPDVGIDPSHIDRAHDLAQRERRLTERLQALIAEEAGPQEQLRDEVLEIGGQMAELRDEVRELGLSGRANGPAHAAAELLQAHAVSTMNRGIGHLNSGQTSAARQAQRQAADHTENAARQAADLAEALRRDLPRPADGGGEPPASTASKGDQATPSERAGDRAELGAARDAQRQASLRLAQARSTPTRSAENARQAADSMQQAAQGLRSAAFPAGEVARRLAQQVGANARLGQPGASQTTTPSGTPGQGVDPYIGALAPANLPESTSAWGELPGHLRTELLEMSQSSYRKDYARLIQLYFREIAAGSPPTPDSPSAPLP
jgi:hypothetical protein